MVAVASRCWRVAGPGLLALLLAGCGSSSEVDVAASGACPYSAPVTADLRSSCGMSSWTAGLTELCAGHLIYRDYLYDDYGADHLLPTIRYNPTSTSALVLPTGDDPYPAGADNTADLVRLDLWTDGDRIEVEFELNTLFDPGQTQAVIAIDSDNDPATGGGRWPGFNTGSAGWDEIHVFHDADPTTNRIRGEFPRPHGGAWKLWAALAQADGTVMNVAFRGQTETSTGSWFDDAQAKALAAGDVTKFAAGVCPSELDAGLTRGAASAPGFHERVYTSAYTLPPGEGISINGILGPKVERSALDPRVYQSYNFLGRYQPYAYYLPAAPPTGLQLFLHGFSQTHAANIGQASVQQAFGEGQNRVLISPLGRGLAGGYSDISERDVLDVLDDALAYFATDPSKTIVSGISMGGYGELAFGTLYPDRFAGTIGYVSPTGNFGVFPGGEPLTYVSGSLVANTAELVRNLTNLPTVLVYGALDEFVPVFESLAFLDRLQQEPELRFDFYLNLDTDHLTTLGADQSKEAALSAGWQRPDRVARVRYRYDPALDVPAYAILHDRAYWASAIRTRGDGSADIDLHSGACGLPEIVTASGSEVGSGPPLIVWQHTFRHAISQSPRAAVPRLDGLLTNVASIRIDAVGACLDRADFAYKIETDGATTLEFSDGRRLFLPAAGLHQGRLQR